MVTHADLHAALRNAGWKEDRREDGTVFFYSPGEILDRAVQTIPADPEHALAIVRGGGQSCTSVAEAATWALDADRHPLDTLSVHKPDVVKHYGGIDKRPAATCAGERYRCGNCGLWVVLTQAGTIPPHLRSQSPGYDADRQPCPAAGRPGRSSTK